MNDYNYHLENVNRKLLTGTIDLSQPYDLCKSSINSLMNQVYYDLIPLGVEEFSCYINSGTEVWRFKTSNAEDIDLRLGKDINNLLINYDLENIILSLDNEILIIGYHGYYTQCVLIKVDKKFQIIIESIIVNLWYKLFDY